MIVAKNWKQKQKQKLSRHKQKLHDTNKNSHGPNENSSAQTKLSQRKSCFSAELPEADLSAMRGYSAICNMMETQFDDDFETEECDAKQDSEESLIWYNFFRTFEYKEIILLLSKDVGI